MAKLKQKQVNAFFSPRRRRVERSNRKLVGEKWDVAPDFSESSSSEDDPGHYKLEAKSQLLDFPESPRYISSSSSDADDDDASSSVKKPARKLVRRSEASSSQAVKPKAAASKPRAQPVASSSKAAAASQPAKSAARAKFESKKGKAVGKEKDISCDLTRAGKWTDDEDEDDQAAAAAGWDDDDWIVDDDDDNEPAASSKGKGKALARAAPAPAPPATNRAAARPMAAVVKAQLSDDDDLAAPAVARSPAVRRTPEAKLEHNSNDSDEPLSAQLPTAASAPASRPTATVEDLLDAAVGSRVSDRPKQPAVVKSEPAVVKTEPAAVKPEPAVCDLDDSDGSVLIMDTPPPESPPKQWSIKKAPAPAEPPKPAPGKSVVKKVKPPPRAQTPPSPSLSPAPVPAPRAAPRGGPSQRSQRLEQRAAQRARPSPKAGPSRSQPSPRCARPARANADLFNGISSEEESEAASQPVARQRGKARAEQAELSDEDDVRIASSNRRKALGKRKATHVSTDDEEEDEEDEEAESSSSDEDRKKRARAKKKEAAGAAKRRKRPLDSTEDEESDDSEADRRRRRKKQKRLRQKKSLVNSEDEEGTDSEPDDLEDDAGRLLTLQNRMRTGTERAGAKELTRRKLLEKLKKRKQQREPGVTSLLTDDEDEESVEEDTYKDVWGRDARGRYETEDDSDFEKEFIEEDDQDIDELDLPNHFRSDASQPMELNFNVVCQWHVHAIIKGRAFVKKSGQADYFRIPLQRLREHVVSTRNSGVTSQVWPAHFKAALDWYPYFDGFSLKNESTPCDACRISSRPATRRIELSGQRFHPTTFERIDATDKQLAKIDSEFNCGRYCFQRADVYHKMTHWEDHIHERLQDVIEQLPDNEDDRPPTTSIRIEGGSYKIGSLPAKSDPDAVLEWLTKRVRWVTSEWSSLTMLIDSGKNLDAQFRRWET